MGIPNNRDNCALTSMLVKIGNELGLKVTAEGVETHAQQDFLRRLGCDEVQGYPLGRPLFPEAAGMLVPACMQVSVAGQQ